MQISILQCALFCLDVVIGSTSNENIRVISSGGFGSNRILLIKLVYVDRPVDSYYFSFQVWSFRNFSVFFNIIFVFIKNIIYLIQNNRTLPEIQNFGMQKIWIVVSHYCCIVLFLQPIYIISKNSREYNSSELVHQENMKKLCMTTSYKYQYV